MGVPENLPATAVGGRRSAPLPLILISGILIVLRAIPALADADSISVAVAEPQKTTKIAQDEPALPRILSDSDVERYRHIFDLQHEGEWKAADAEIAGLQDRVLMGNVMAQRLLHPRLYRATYAELEHWLDEYSDHPEAVPIYTLALRRKPAKEHAPPRPDGSFLAGMGSDFGLEGETPPDHAPILNDADEHKAQRLKAAVRAHLRSGWPTGAKALIDTDEARRLFGPVEYDELRADIAASYFAYGKDEDALALAEETARHADGKVPAAHWTAGIADWRMGRHEAAIRHFEAIAKSPYASRWDASAAAFWAARANLVTRQPKEVNRWLKIAAEDRHTFYGMLARRALGLDTNFDWNAPKLDSDDLSRIKASPGARRALALLQVGEHRGAEDELRKVYSSADQDLAQSILALALHGEFPGLAMRIGVKMARDSGHVLDAALYPVPSWKPQQGYTIDRALLFAVMRQESHFDAKAQSSAGARGLMQIMPGTAKFISDNFPDGEDEDGTQLFDPVSNTAMGQKYLGHLLEDDSVRGNLLLLAAAYNGGPAKVAEWKKRIDDQGDPLLFLESIPSRETRGFVERVLANMWIYQQRLGQPSPSLDAVAAGDWPQYGGIDGRDVDVAGNAGN